MEIQPNADRIQRDIETLASYTDPGEKGYTRLSFSEQIRQANAYAIEKMQSEAGLQASVDVIGNLIGRREGDNPDLPALMIGSHLDTVKAGGRFDGVIGVLAGLEIARCLNAAGVTLNHPLEVVSFLAEEPSPYGMSTIGSRAMTGHLSLEALQKARSIEGESLYDAIRRFGGNPDQLDQAVRAPGSIGAFLEMHIEQGPVLYKRQIPIGIVSGIVSIYRGEITITGESNHAGTTPMHLRKDALPVAARLISDVDRIARSTRNLVITIGELELQPNASNVIPGKVKLGIEMRSLEESVLQKSVERIEGAVCRCRPPAGVEIARRFWLSSPQVRFPDRIIEIAQRSCEKLKFPYLTLPSGAGHDASYLAEIAPTGMIFVPSVNGLSHCPDEYTPLEDIVRGIKLMGDIVLELDRQL